MVHVIRINKELRKHQEVYTAARQAIFEQYGDSKDGTITVPKDNMPAFQVALAELFDMEFETMDAIKLTEDFVGENALSPHDVLVLDPIFDDSELLGGSPKKKKMKKKKKKK